MVERVARAICIGNPDFKMGTDGEGGLLWEMYADQARAAIAAMREPTEAMIDEGGCFVGACDVTINGVRRRDDLGADIFREMLCVSDLCSYGTSPRVCFPTQPFKALLPALIEKWRAYAVLVWGEGWDNE